MNYLKIILISIIFTQLCCQNNPKIKVKQAPQYLAKNDEKVLKNRTIIELKKDWDSLTNVKSCLSGGQWIKDKKWGGEGCILTGVVPI
jgi:hypothetical protein